METKKSASEEIEESLRICEELMRENAGFTPGTESPIDGLDELLGDIPAFGNETEPVNQNINTEPVVPRSAEPAVRDNSTASTIPQSTEPAVPKIHLEPVVPHTIRQETVTPPEPPKKRRVLRTLVSLVICAGIAVVVAILITKFVANHTTVDGSSMEPTLQNGDNLVIEKISYLTGEPQRFDIIVFEHSENSDYIKRIIGLPGESVRIEEGKIYINDKPIYDEYGDGNLIEAGIAEKTITLAADEYFVLGDNRDRSEDSRDERVGPVKADKILGKAWLRVTPFEHFGILS